MVMKFRFLFCGGKKKGRKNCLWVEVHKFSIKSALKQHDRLVNAIQASKDAHHDLNHYSQTRNRKPCFSTTQRSSAKNKKPELYLLIMQPVGERITYGNLYVETCPDTKTYI